MKDQAKALANTLCQALQQKGIELSTGASLDITSQLLGTKDWNALSAVVSERRAAGSLQQAVRTLLAAMAELASNAGDVPEWNRGGFAYEARELGQRVLRGQEVSTRGPAQTAPAPDSSVQALRAFVKEVAEIPLEGEFCLEAIRGLQSWDDGPVTYNKLESLALQARHLLHPENSRTQVEMLQNVHALPQGSRVLDELVADLAESYAERVANTCADEDEQEEVYEAWDDKAAHINNMGPALQLQFLVDGHGAQEAQRLLEAALAEARS